MKSGLGLRAGQRLPDFFASCGSGSIYSPSLAPELLALSPRQYSGRMSRADILRPASVRRMRHPAASSGPLIRSVILAHYARVAASMKLDAAEMIRRVGLDPLCLVDPNIPIPAVGAMELLERSAIESGTRDFGIRFSLARGIPDLGPLNLLLREEPDLRSALRSLQRFLYLHSHSVRIDLQEDEFATVDIGFNLTTPLPFAAPQSTEMVVCGILQMIRWLVGAEWSPLRVCFSHIAPGGGARHRSLLACRADFGCTFDGLVLKRADLNRVVMHSSPVLREYARAYMETLARTASSDFPQRVRDLIGALLPAGRCSIAAVARHLGVHRATLSRRLALSNQSFSDLLQATRVELASRSCLGGLPLGEVALQLGFADLSVFSRWFRQSFRCSATDWRRRMQARNTVSSVL